MMNRRLAAQNAWEHRQHHAKPVQPCTHRNRVEQVKPFTWPDAA